MSKLEQARVYKKLKQLEHAGDSATGDLRDFLASNFQVSGRTLDRWVRLLDTPVEVQRAWEQGRVRLDAAGRVCDEPKETQRRIATMIRQGHDPANVVSEYAPKRQGKFGSKIGRDLQRFLGGLERELHAITTPSDLVYRKLKPEHLAVLRRANKAIVSMIRFIKETQGQ